MHPQPGYDEGDERAADELDKPAVLALQGVSFRGRSENGAWLRHAELQLRAGDLAVVHVDPAVATRELVSMLQGLTLPSEGQVLFRGQDWLGNDHQRHFQMRSQIGRVFEGQAWIENLNVDENVTLARRHHGMASAELQADVQSWVARLGIEGLSRRRPAFVEPSVLQVHQWIRAFVGSPSMVVLEHPLQFLSHSWRTKLLHAIDQLRATGTAVLWFTSLSFSNRDLDSGGRPLARCRLVRCRLVDGQFRSSETGTAP